MRKKDASKKDSRFADYEMTKPVKSLRTIKKPNIITECSVRIVRSELVEAKLASSQHQAKKKRAKAKEPPVKIEDNPEEINSVQIEENSVVSLKQDEVAIEQPEISLKQDEVAMEQSEISLKQDDSMEEQTCFNIEIEESMLQSFICNLTCSKCDVSIVNYTDFFLHLNDYHIESLFCHLCPRENLSLVQISTHLSEEHADKVFADEYLVALMCQLKPNDFTCAVKARKRKPLILKSVLKTCLLCQEDTADLKEHLTNCHNYCRACCVSFGKYSEFVRHKLQHIQGHMKFIQCTLCGVQLKTSSALLQHSKSSHKNSNVEYELLEIKDMTMSEEKCACPYCGSVTVVPNQEISLTTGLALGLQEHSSKHSLLTCTCCQNDFIASEESPKKCTVCETTSKPAAKKRRVRKVKEPKEKKLEPVTRKAKQKTAVKNTKKSKVYVDPHEYRDIPCILCSKFKGNATEMYAHCTEIHNLCRICGKDFDTDVQLECHVERHNDGSLTYYHCIYCNGYIEDRNEYLVHVESHDKTKKPFIKEKRVPPTVPALNGRFIEINKQCPFCHSLIIKSFMGHLKVKHKIFECEKCVTKFVAKTEGQTECEICNPIIIDNADENINTVNTPENIVDSVDTENIVDNVEIISTIEDIDTLNTVNNIEIVYTENIENV
ncbi:hypothetical protein B566_EDAN012412 [Ephemera danica]|nr:hypothetical protein B566_EDAN012412 [Ephemera danica]